MALAEHRLQQLEARLSRGEQELSSLKRKDAAPEPAAEARNLQPWDKLQAELEMGESISSGELVATRSELFGGALFTSAGEEIRGGIATDGPCYQLQHSVWDVCLWIGLPVLSRWDSVVTTLLLLLNILAQVSFVAVVQIDMLEDALTPDQLRQLLIFRTNVAHDVQYADLGGGRSLARRVCSQDDSLQLANAQSALVTDLYNYKAIGPVLALLAIGCWLSTTLKEIFDVLAFIGAIRTCPVGDVTEVSTLADEDAPEDSNVVVSRMSPWRKCMLVGLVAIPRLGVACALMHTGTRYLANTLSLSDLILNAVALAFILDLDELIESAFMPRRPRFLLDKLGALPISKPPCPGLGYLKIGLQERIWNLLQIALLVVGLVLSWHLLLHPLHQTVHQALDILCSGRQDFVFAVNSATGIIQAAPTFPDEAPLKLSSQQEGVLQLANLELFHTNLFPTDIVDKLKASAKALEEEFDDVPTVTKIYQVLLLDKSDVSAAAENLPCTDSAFPLPLVRAQLRSVTGGLAESCQDVSSRDDLCAEYNLSSIRALCPQTCGCDDPLEPAAAGFATVPSGCPRRCTPLRDDSPRLLHAPCQDWTTAKLLSSDYIRRYLTGAFTNALITKETRRASTLLYTTALKRRFYHLLPGPNKTESLQKAGEYFAAGSWHQDVINGKFELGVGIPHPRGLEGCEFFASEEVVELAGGSICSPRSEISAFVSLRPQCPVTCGCHADQPECPGTCPQSL